MKIQLIPPTFIGSNTGAIIVSTITPCSEPRHHTHFEGQAYVDFTDTFRNVMNDEPCEFEYIEKFTLAIIVQGSETARLSNIQAIDEAFSRFVKNELLPIQLATETTV